MKVYARQINPEYQESPLFLGEDFWPDIIMCGNRRLVDHTTPEYDMLAENLSSMSWDHADYDDYQTVEILRDYGIRRSDDKAWTPEQLKEWDTVLEMDDEQERMLAALSLVTGETWKSGTIYGYSQSDWQDVIYPAEWTREQLSAFETEYFNTGSEWIIHDEEDDPETPEDISGYSVYCHGWSDDEIRAEIANIEGVDPSDVVLYAFDGYKRTALYREVV